MALDKLDKIGKEGVVRELLTLGLQEEQTQKLFALLEGADLEGEATQEVERNLKRYEISQLKWEWMKHVFNWTERWHED